jgi:hypothetical protein
VGVDGINFILSTTGIIDREDVLRASGCSQPK